MENSNTPVRNTTGSRKVLANATIVEHSPANNRNTSSTALAAPAVQANSTQETSSSPPNNTMNAKVTIGSHRLENSQKISSSSSSGSMTPEVQNIPLAKVASTLNGVRSNVTTGTPHDGHKVQPSADIENSGSDDVSATPEVRNPFPLVRKGSSETRPTTDQSNSSVVAPQNEKDKLDDESVVRPVATMGHSSSLSSAENELVLFEGSSRAAVSQDNAHTALTLSTSNEDREDMSPMPYVGQGKGSKGKSSTMRLHKIAEAGKKRWSSFKFRSNTAPPEPSTGPNEFEFLRHRDIPTLERHQHSQRASVFYYGSPFVQPTSDDLPCLELHTKNTPGLSALLQSV